MSDAVTERRVRAENALGDGRIICKRCGATLATFADRCTAALHVQCEGFRVIDTAAASTQRDGDGDSTWFNDYGTQHK